MMAIGLVLSTSCNRPDTDLSAPPQAVIAVSPDTLLTTTMVQFDCSKSLAGSDQDKVYYRWDWNNDGIWDEEYSSDPIFVHRFYSKAIVKHTYFETGDFQPTMEVRDPQGMSHWNIALLKEEDKIYPGYSSNSNFLSVRCIKNE
jgi:hypothetical protein